MIWNALTGFELVELKGYNDIACSLDFHPDDCSDCIGACLKTSWLVSSFRIDKP